MYKQHYSRFLAGNKGRLHFAAHSHHFWPDVTRAAALACWDGAAAAADSKWDGIFSTVIPTAQQHIARTLNLPSPDSLAFAPNTHEFVFRLLSCLDLNGPLRIVTSDGEFHSFRRQSARLEELPGVEVVRVPVEPFTTFPERYLAAISEKKTDMAFFSHVFFDSGYVLPDPAALAQAAAKQATMVVIDGYHGFRAVPTDLSACAGSAFYLAGGYKYAQAGEGACFLHVPAGCSLRPLDTGWFADFSALEAAPGAEIGYGPAGSRFWGATFDPSGLYRFNAVQDFFTAEGITVEQGLKFVRSLQQQFLSKLGEQSFVDPATRVVSDLDRSGHFLTFRRADAVTAAQRLAEAQVIVDARGDRLRFGFGLYHDTADVDALISALVKLP
jgi:kynureninase